MTSAIAKFGVGAFRMAAFRDQAEFEQHAKEFDAVRGGRWLYEQSLASPKDELVLPGTCGLCLTEAQFTARTRGGELTASGRVPNWREELVCDCDHRLINRERALLHYLLTTGAIEPWMRVLALGEINRLRGVLTGLSSQIVCHAGTLASAMDSKALTPATRADGYHLVVSSEQLNAGSARPDLIAALADMLTPGGRLVFTAPFNASLPAPTDDTGPLGWSILTMLASAGLADARACTYWSEEFGYLGPMNFIFAAER